MNTNTLPRFAACVQSLVDAGCPGLPIGLNLAPTGGTFIVSLCAANIIVDDSDAEREKGVVVARLEQWFNHAVVPWACDEEHIGGRFRRPRYNPYSKRHHWNFGSAWGSDPDPTLATLECLESLVRVVKGVE